MSFHYIDAGWSKASWTYFCAAELSIQPGNEYIIVSNRFVWALVHMNRIWFVRGTSQKLLSEVDIFVTEYNDIFWNDSIQIASFQTGCNLDFGRMVSGLNRDEVQIHTRPNPTFKKTNIFWSMSDYILEGRI